MISTSLSFALYSSVTTVLVKMEVHTCQGRTWMACGNFRKTLKKKLLLRAAATLHTVCALSSDLNIGFWSRLSQSPPTLLHERITTWPLKQSPPWRTLMPDRSIYTATERTHRPPSQMPVCTPQVRIARCDKQYALYAVPAKLAGKSWSVLGAGVRLRCRMSVCDGLNRGFVWDGGS
ncbi:hypothetical protein HDK90DRAFT_21978 [Phyllosticta capitalensis]|uniref:Secreted protein n=1 Tax=Phyllosticta capitalensis TaxID=121624 RepID=A0ABR1Z3F9_9PEZI